MTEERLVLAELLEKAGKGVRWTPIVRQPEPLPKV